MSKSEQLQRLADFERQREKLMSVEHMDGYYDFHMGRGAVGIIHSGTQQYDLVGKAISQAIVKNWAAIHADATRLLEQQAPRELEEA